MISIHSSSIKPYLTPFKYPYPVLIGSGKPGAFDELAVDIPFVFYHQRQFHMLYTGFDGKGYQSALAVSDDLIHWNPKGTILKRDENSNRWDHFGRAGTWIIKKSDMLHDMPCLRKIDGKYWMVYHSYPGVGYEEGPAEIGLAYTEDEELMHWTPLERPIISWRDGDDWEKGGLYKACIVQSDHTWYMFYNAKNTEKRWIEQTGMAVSKDLFHWQRSSRNPILKVTKGGWDGRFVSDPCIVKDGAQWLNFYFGYDYGHAQEGLAVSENLTDWEKVDSPIIHHGKHGEMDEGHVHKASVVYHNDTLYHFYCATRPYRKGDPTKMHDEFRYIAVATGKKLPIKRTISSSK